MLDMKVSGTAKQLSGQPGMSVDDWGGWDVSDSPTLSPVKVFSNGDCREGMLQEGFSTVERKDVVQTLHPSVLLSWRRPVSESAFGDGICAGPGDLSAEHGIVSAVLKGFHEGANAALTTR